MSTKIYLGLREAFRSGKDGHGVLDVKACEAKGDNTITIKTNVKYVCAVALY